MTGSYYFWKWADNDLPGRPGEVHAALVRGQLHPALQIFDARLLLETLESAAARGREHAEEWNWELSPGDAPIAAQFVFVTCPCLKEPSERTARFEREFFPLGLSGCDEQSGQLIPRLLPKLNLFKMGQLRDEPSYDITVDDLPALLRCIDSHAPDPFAILEDNRSRFVQCYAHGRRFCVEWRENYDPPVYENFDQWRAQDRARLAVLDVPYHKNIPHRKDPDLLLYADTLRIFQAFMRGEPRPERYHWMNINSWFSKK